MMRGHVRSFLCTPFSLALVNAFPVQLRDQGLEGVCLIEFAWLCQRHRNTRALELAGHNAPPL